MDPLTGIIFSDLGQASSFMALAWVQDSLKECLGYYPFPATLNLRPKAAQDSQIWRRAQSELAGVPLPPAANGFCSARIFRVAITGQDKGPVEGAILLPEVKDYPSDKIEIVAPMQLKNHLAVQDGDQLTLEFLN
jgi:CTP-dependent riboflavin kinase